MFRATSLKSRSQSTCSLLHRQLSGKATIQEGDVVLLKRKRAPLGAPILTSPLRKGRSIQRKWGLELKGIIKEDSIIGKGVRDTVISTKGDEFRIYEPSLSEYITYSPRLVTPIYPQNAALMVDLLDLHPTAFIEGNHEAPLEIFEAGTGHGSLTLHLSRAIHAANSRPPNLPPASILKKLRSYRKERSISLEHNDIQSPKKGVLAKVIESVASEDNQSVSSSSELSSHPTEIFISGLEKPVKGIQDVKAECIKWFQSTDDVINEYEQGLKFTQDMKAEYERWLPTRRAIIQTLDISAQHSEHAEQIVRSYGRGIYYPNINFHVGTIPEYLSRRLEDEHEPFLQHVILDLPDTHTYLDLISKVLKPNGLLLLFCPSITQIVPSIQRVKNERLPFVLEKVLEIGGIVGTGGRQWDLKLVKTRKQIKDEALVKAAEKQYKSQASTNGDSNTVEIAQDISEEVPAESEPNDDNWNIICHPQVGGRVENGAFVAVWRRMEQY